MQYSRENTCEEFLRTPILENICIWLAVLWLLVKRCNNILLCVVWLDRKYCRWNCNGNTSTNTLYSVLHREPHKISFICCFMVTAKNLIWPVVFLFLCSWWQAKEQYLFAALIAYSFLSVNSSATWIIIK